MFGTGLELIKMLTLKLVGFGMNMYRLLRSNYLQQFTRSVC